MALQAWPTALPNGWLVGTPIAVSPGVVGRRFASGRLRQRREIVYPHDRYEARLDFDPVEFRLFEYFVKTVLNRIDWYSGPYHDGGGLQTGTLRLVGGAYQARHGATTGAWTVNAVIEIEGRK